MEDPPFFENPDDAWRASTYADIGSQQDETVIPELSPWNPADIPRLIRWTFFEPGYLKAYLAHVGPGGVQRVGSWISAFLFWGPLVLSLLGLAFLQPTFQMRLRVIAGAAILALAGAGTAWFGQYDRRALACTIMGAALALTLPLVTLGVSGVVAIALLIQGMIAVGLLIQFQGADFLTGVRQTASGIALVGAVIIGGAGVVSGVGSGDAVLFFMSAAGPHPIMVVFIRLFFQALVGVIAFLFSFGLFFAGAFVISYPLPFATIFILEDLSGGDGNRKLRVACLILLVLGGLTPLAWLASRLLRAALG